MVGFARSAQSAGTVAAVSFGVIFFLATMGELAGFDWQSMLRDPQPSSPAISGAVSYLGIALMMLVGCVCLIGAATQTGKRTMFATIGVFAFFFAADDLLLWHEGTFEIYFIVGYVIAGAALYLAIQATFDRLIIWPIVVAFGCFALSILVDQFWNALQINGQPLLPRGHWSVGILLEDGFKFAGIMTFAVSVLGEVLPEQKAPTHLRKGIRLSDRRA